MPFDKKSAATDKAYIASWNQNMPFGGIRDMGEPLFRGSDEIINLLEIIITDADSPPDVALEFLKLAIAFCKDVGVSPDMVGGMLRGDGLLADRINDLIAIPTPDTAPDTAPAVPGRQYRRFDTGEIDDGSYVIVKPITVGDFTKAQELSERNDEAIFDLIDSWIVEWGIYGVDSVMVLSRPQFTTLLKIITDPANGELVEPFPIRKRDTELTQESDIEPPPPTRRRKVKELPDIPAL